MQIDKLIKWSASALRVASAKMRLGYKLRLPSGGKPVYLGRKVRLDVERGGVMEFGSGVYIDDHCRLQVCPDAHMSIGEGCYLNTNCRVVAAEDLNIGAQTMLGPNACVFDHDHVFDAEGVHGDLVSAPVVIGERCWLGANVLITKGVSLADKICVGGAVVTHSLSESGVYAGMPVRIVRRITRESSGLDDPAKAQETQTRNDSTQDTQRAMATQDLQGPRKEA